MKPLSMKPKGVIDRPAAFRRLCVETSKSTNKPALFIPAAFRRLCVETATLLGAKQFKGASRLQAAVC